MDHQGGRYSGAQSYTVITTASRTVLWHFSGLGCRGPKLRRKISSKACVRLSWPQLYQCERRDRSWRFRRSQAGKRRLPKLDVTLEVNGFMADACESVAVGSVDNESKQLMQCASRAFWSGLAAVRPGVRAFDIGKEDHRAVSAAGYCIVRNLSGHGIGRMIHERPTVPNEFDRRCCDVLMKGLVFTIEPLIAVGTSRSITLKDGWTVRTIDRSCPAHYEPTVFVTSDGARLPQHSATQPQK
jgi:Xaa-Pro aminopeptidase